MEYKMKLRRGIDDLKGGLPEQGTEWWTDKMWKEYHDNLHADHEWNKQYIADLKAKGQYGEEYEMTFTMQPNPVFDSPGIQSQEPLTSHSFIFIP